MSDWQVGDLAVCVDGGPGRDSRWRVCGQLFREGDGPLEAGQIYTVRAIRADVDHLAFGLVEIPGPWRADRFRKLRPDAHEACEEEFATLLKRAPAKVHEFHKEDRAV